MAVGIYGRVLIGSAFGCVVYPGAVFIISALFLPSPLALLLCSLYVVAGLIPLVERPRWATRLLKDAVDAARDYFPLTVKFRPEKFEKPGPYVIGLEPHSALPVAVPATMNTHSTMLPPACHNCHSLATSAVFWVPLGKHWWHWLDIRPATRASFRTLLEEGKTVCVTPGGVQECLYMSKDKETAFLKKRLGFVRIALEHGTPLVPAFAFGQSDLYHYIRPGPPLVPFAAVRWLSRKLGFVPLLLWGSWLSTLPLQRPFTVVLADPIIVPKIENPTDEDCKVYLDKFISALETLVEEEKAAAGHPGLQLSVL